MSVSHFDLYKPNSRPSSGKGPHNEPSNQEKMGVGKGRLESQESNTSDQNSLCPLPASQPHPFVSVPHQTPLSKLKTLESFSSPIWSPIWSQNLPLVSPAPLTLPQLNSIVPYAWSPSETWIFRSSTQVVSVFFFFMAFLSTWFNVVIILKGILTSQQMNRPSVNFLFWPSFANSSTLHHYQLLIQSSELRPVQS